MSVQTVNIGPKRVALTAYCPDDPIGLLAAEYVVRRAAELLADVDYNALKAWALDAFPEPTTAALFAVYERGEALPRNPPWTVDPCNAKAELRIIDFLQREMMEQRR